MQHPHTIPLPRPASLLLFGGSALCWLTHHVNHDQASLLMQAILFACALTSYGYRFVKWCRKTK